VVRRKSFNGFQVSTFLGFHHYIVRQALHGWNHHLIFMRTNPFIIRVHYVLLPNYLFHRGENRLMQLVCNIQKFAHNHSMFYCLTKWQFPKPFSKAVQVFALDHFSGHKSSIYYNIYACTHYINFVHWLIW